MIPENVRAAQQEDPAIRYSMWCLKNSKAWTLYEKKRAKCKQSTLQGEKGERWKIEYSTGKEQNRYLVPSEDLKSGVLKSLYNDVVYVSADKLIHLVCE